MVSQKVDLSRSGRECALFTAGASGSSPDMGVRQDVSTNPAIVLPAFYEITKISGSFCF
jgi:hypothetical protein